MSESTEKYTVSMTAAHWVSPNIAWADYLTIQKMNPSTLVAGCKSMLRLKRAIDGGYPEETNAMRVGTGVHALLLEPEEFENRFCVLPDFHLDEDNVTGKGERSESKATKYYKNSVRDFINSRAGKSFLTRAQYDGCLTCIEAIRSRPAMDALLSGASTEVTVQGEIDGVPFKGRIDALKPRLILDVKTTQDVAPRSFGRIFANLHYGFKLSIYRELIRQNFGYVPEVKIIAQEVGGDFDNCLIPIPEIILENAMTRVRGVLREYKQCLDSGRWPGVDGGEDEIDLYLPQWAMEDAEDLDWSGVAT